MVKNSSLSITSNLMRTAVLVYNKQIKKRNKIAFISAILGLAFVLLWLLLTILCTDATYTVILFPIACICAFNAMIYISSIKGFRKWMLLGKYDWLEKVRVSKINCVKIFWLQVLDNDLLKV